MKKSEAMEKYRRYLKQKGCTEATIKHYKMGAEKFIEYLEKEKGIERIQDVKKEHIRDYQNKVHALKRQRDGKALSLSFKTTLLVSVKRYFDYLEKIAEVMYNPASSLEIPKRKQGLREVLKVREMKQIIESAKGETAIELRDRAILEVLYTCGIRNTELRNIKMRDIDLETREIRIERGKGGKGRVVPIGRIAAAYVEEYIRESRLKLLKEKDTEYLFISKRGRKLEISMPNKMVKKYAIKAKIKKKVRTHMLRHSCATHLLKGGADIRYVQEILGHSSLDSTQVYTKVEIGDLKRTHRRSHPREKL